MPPCKETGTLTRTEKDKEELVVVIGVHVVFGGVFYKKSLMEWASTKESELGSLFGFSLPVYAWKSEDLHIWDGDFAVPIRCCPLAMKEREKRDEGECLRVFSKFTSQPLLF